MENPRKRFREFSPVFSYPKKERIDDFNKFQKKKNKKSEQIPKKKTTKLEESQKKEIEILKTKIDNLNDKIDLIMDHISKLQFESSIKEMEKVKLTDCNYIS